jgi:hypothetical protein
MYPQIVTALTSAAQLSFHHGVLDQLRPGSFSFRLESGEASRSVETRYQKENETLPQVK